MTSNQTFTVSHFSIPEGNKVFQFEITVLDLPDNYTTVYQAGTFQIDINKVFVYKLDGTGKDLIPVTAVTGDAYLEYSTNEAYSNNSDYPLYANNFSLRIWFVFDSHEEFLLYYDLLNANLTLGQYEPSDLQYINSVRMINGATSIYFYGPVGNTNTVIARSYGSYNALEPANRQVNQVFDPKLLFKTSNQTFTVSHLSMPEGNKVFEFTITVFDLPDDYTTVYYPGTYQIDKNNVIVYELDGTGAITKVVTGDAYLEQYSEQTYSNSSEYPFFNNNFSLVIRIQFESNGEFLQYYDFANSNITKSSQTTLGDEQYVDAVEMRLPGSPPTISVNFGLTYPDLSTGYYGNSNGSYSETVPSNKQVNQVFSPSLLCFCKGTLLLGPNGYVAVENFKVGDMVTTYLYGHRKIVNILRGVSVNIDNVKAQHTMCVMKQVDGMTGDLYMTGGHSIIVDELNSEETEKQAAIGFSQKVDDKPLLLAMVSSLFEAAPLGKYQHYHFVLENEGNPRARYGVWANGVLCETPSQEYVNI